MNIYMNFGKHTVYTQETRKIITSNSLSLNIIRAKQPDIAVKDIKTHDSKSQGQHSTRKKLLYFAWADQRV